MVEPASAKALRESPLEKTPAELIRAYEPFVNYVVRSPGKPVNVNGKIINMNRAARRRNKIR